MFGKRFYVPALLMVAHVPIACAQSSVTLFGALDVGLSYVSNEGGHGNAKFDDGIFTPSLLGLRGSEDVGGGSKVIFQLVSQISPGTGALIGNGLFARTAYVGVQNDRLGTLTFGNQYEFMADTLFFSGTDAAADVAGLYNLRNGPFRKLALPGNPTGAFDWDRMAGSQRVANAVKFVSPVIHGLKAGALYAFGGVPGSIGAGNTVSASLDYEAGPFGAAAAYTNEKYGAQPGSVATSVRNWGAGAHYRIGRANLSALVTTVHNAASGGSVWMAESGGTWQLSGPVRIGADYMYMKGNAALDNDHAHQVTATVQYTLSKRTMVYATGVWQRASSGARAQINGVLDPDGASSGANQAIARIGLHTLF
ncbi:porin [Burkholderia sp. BCC1993]|uniref:porin n=1 Tax=Burkholderia sp. BCC1993 TaxID=2817444 RepID=UPI002AB1BA3D|nr:porin [Burkholderia sp. BCC1993]